MSSLVLPLTGPLTLEAAIRRTAAAFDAAALSYGHGTDNAIDEAGWLLLHALGLPAAVAPDYNMHLGSAERRDCNLLINHRIEKRVPVAYLTGTAWFAGHEFYSDSRALVPRSPLAEYISNHFYSHVSIGSMRILDLCTGGGCIAIACAHAVPLARVVGSDLSTDALSLAAENVSLHSLEDRVNLIHGSLFKPVTGKFDLIISNPPYVDANEIASMPDEFRHEPLLGLAAGVDGLDLVRTILLEAGDYLTEQGVLVVEVGNSAAALAASFPNVPFDWLEFSNGGAGVFLLDHATLVRCHEQFLKKTGV
ncbi:MAG: 50S ribosomal protein L3 N(5)-glutamine methyltransferase [Granulosicoccus sp.]